MAARAASEINTIMTIYTINTGSSANKGDGDSLRTAFHKINLNFAYLSTQTGGGGGGGGGNAGTGSITFANNVISTTATNQDIIFDPNGVGRVRFRNTAIQFDNGTGGNTGAGSHILYTRGADKVVGLGIDGANSSLRIVGDKDTLGTLVDMGMYTGALGVWSSKVLVNYQGNLTAAGEVLAQQGFRFPDGTLQTTAGQGLTLSEITTGTISNEITGVQTIRFDTNSGFELTNLGSGAVQVGMNSTFKYWQVAGQPTLIAEGLDTVEIIAGAGMTITTNNTATTKTIRFEALEGGGLGNFVINGSTFYNSAVNQKTKIINAVTGTSYIEFPRFSTPTDDFIIESNTAIEIRSTAGVDNNIFINPANSYVNIGTNSTSSSAGVFIFAGDGPTLSEGGGVSVYPNKNVADYDGFAVYSDLDTGIINLYSNDNGNISVRPEGTGTFIVTGNIQNRKNVLYSTKSNYAAGGNASSSTYQAGALLLDVNKQVHSLFNGDYYLPPGLEGQIAYFAPQDAAQGANSTRIWFQKVRVMVSNLGIELYNQEWYPFKPNSSQAQGVVYAIYINGAWTPSHSYIS